MDHVLVCQSSQKKRVVLGKAVQGGIDMIEIEMDRLKYKKQTLRSLDPANLPLVVLPPF